MTKKRVKLSSNDFWPLLNIINEVCYGINVNNFEVSMGIDKSTAIDFMDSMAKEEDKSEVNLELNDAELFFLKNSFAEVFKQIDEWEFQTRIGISMQEARKIQEKLK